jgi:hypothetical protein
MPKNMELPEHLKFRNGQARRSKGLIMELPDARSVRLVDRHDIYHAQAAAMAVFKNHRVDPKECWLAYKFAKEFKVPQQLPAKIWEVAQLAANRALTEGWHNPNGAKVILSWKTEEN